MSKLNGAKEAFTFDDLSLVPRYSSIRSRKDPDVSTTLGKIALKIPIISSPMSTVTAADMAETMAIAGGVGIIHRYMSIDDHVASAKATIGRVGDYRRDKIMCAIGANGDSMDRARALWDAGIRGFCIDVANGHSVHCIETVARIRDGFPGAHIMAGNVCTSEGVRYLAQAGANSIRVGIGGGSMCKTRVVTGHGVPQLSAIEECANIDDGYGVFKKDKNVSIIADGGIRSAGDIVKALAIGADSVMLGGLLAGTSDTPGEEHVYGGQLCKHYSGMASEMARESYFNKEKTSYVPEGESTRVPYKGSTIEVVDALVAGLRVGMSYSGARTLEELNKKASWTRVTANGAVEGTPHGVR